MQTKKELLRGGPGEKIPEGAKRVTRNEVINILFEKLRNLEPSMDIFVLKYGNAILGGLSSISGLLMHRHFRKQLSLRREGLISTTVPCVLLPFMGSMLCHTELTLPQILLQEKYCSVCLELKSGLTQIFFGFMWPYALGMIAASVTAYRIGAYLPSALHIKDYFKFSVQLMKAGKGPNLFAGLLIGNFFGAMIVVYAQGQQVFRFHKRLEMRRVLEEN